MLTAKPAVLTQEERQAFLADASSLLLSPLNLEERLAAVTRLVVPRLADWCAVYLPEPDGRLVPLAVAHEDEHRLELLRRYLERYPISSEDASGAGAVYRNGKPDVVPLVTDQMLEAILRDEPERLAIIRGLGLRSGLNLPLLAHGRSLGVLSLASSSEDRLYSSDDLPFSEEVAQRVAASLDNAIVHEQLRASEERLRVTLESIGDGVITTNEAGCVTFSNPVAEALTGRRNADTIGLSIAEAFPIVNESTREPVENPVTRVLREGRIIGLANHTVLLRPDGSDVPIDDSGAPIRGPEGRIAGAVLVFRDVSEARRTQEAMLRLNADLERRVEERTAALEARNRTLEAFINLSRELTLDVSPSELIGSAQGIVLSLLPPGYAVYFETDGSTWRLRSQRGDLGDPALQAALDGGLPYEQARNLVTPWETGQPYYQASYDPSTDNLGPAVQHVGATACLPLVVRGKRRGVFAVGTLYSGHDWAGADRAVLETAVRSLGAAIERAEAIAALERTRERAELLAALSNSLQNASTPEAVFGTAIAAIGSGVGAEYMLVFRLHGDRLRLVHQWGEVPPSLTPILAPGLAREHGSLSWQAFAANEARYTEDYRSQPYAVQYENAAIIAGAEPIRAGDGRLLGVFTIVRAPDLGPWEAAERDLIARGAATIGLALERAENTATLAARNDELASRNEEIAAQAKALDAFVTFTEAAGSESDVLSLARKAQEVIRTAIGEGSTAYYELEGEVWRARSWFGDIDETAARAISQTGFPAAGATFGPPARTLQAHFYDAWNAETEGKGDVVEATREYETVAIYPIVIHGRVHSMFATGLKSTPRWSERHKAIIRAVGRGLTLAVERAESNARLERQNAQLETRNAESEAFAYAVSHDLRQPVLAIAGMNDLLVEAIERGDREEAAYLTQRISANTTRMSALLNDVLTVTRIGRVEEPTSELDLAEVVAGVLDELRPRLEREGVEVLQDGEAPRVRYAPNEAHQLVANLLGNAVKWAGREPGRPFSEPPTRPPRVRLRYGHQAEAVVLHVEDNGPGVPEHLRERVFRLFEKLDAKSEGTGVGLAIVKRIAERYGGRVSIEDSSLGGAGFVVTLPGA